MSFKISLFFFFIFFWGNISENFAWKWQTSPSACELISSKPVHYSTPSPTNVNTSEAVLVHTALPVFQQNVLLAPLKVINTGSALKIQGNPPPNTARTFGGVFCNETYIFREIIFYQTKNLKGRSYSTIDGVGAPLTFVVTYFNKKYGSFQNALRYRNGVVLQEFLTDFTPADNPLFYLLEIFINLLRKAGSFLYLPAALSSAWLDRFSFLSKYYAYLGSYHDPETGKQYESAIILTARIVLGVSQAQFERFFLKLQNTHGGILDNAPPLQPFGEHRKLLESYGLLQILTPV